MFPRFPQFGAIMYRAAELIGKQGSDSFEELGIPISGRLVSIVLAIAKFGPLSSTELAQRIGHSRQAIEARMKPAIANGLFVSIPDPADGRRQLYTFSEDAQVDVDRVVSTMSQYETVYDALWKEIGTDLEQAVSKMEVALQRKPLTVRLHENFPEHDRRK